LEIWKSSRAAATRRGEPDDEEKPPRRQSGDTGSSGFKLAAKAITATVAKLARLSADAFGDVARSITKKIVRGADWFSAEADNSASPYYDPFDANNWSCSEDDGSSFDGDCSPPPDYYHPPQPVVE
jgi:hypothetical protein